MLIRALRRVLEEVRQTDSPSAAHLQQAITGLEVPALVADDHARIVITNAAASTLTGYSASELRRLSVYDITGGRDVELVDVLWRAFTQQRRQSGRYEIKTKDGRVILADYVAIANVVPGLHLSLLRRLLNR